jgi:hypothetical protein
MADESAKIVSLFGKKPILKPDDNELIEFAKQGEPPAAPLHDKHLVTTIESMLELARKGEIVGLCAFATSVKSEMPRFWITVGTGRNDQVEAQRYLAHTHMLGTMCERMIYNGIKALD